MRDQPEAAGEKQAGKRADDGDVEILYCLLSFVLDFRQAAKYEESDRIDANTVAHRHHAVAKLVKHHRPEKEHTGDDSKRPVLRRSPAGMFRGELSPQREGNQQEDDQPAGMNIDRDSKDSSERNA